MVLNIRKRASEAKSKNITFTYEDGTCVEIPEICLRALIDSRELKDRALFGDSRVDLNPAALNLPFNVSYWEPEAESGWKMYGDNPYHTDIVMLVTNKVEDKETNDLLADYQYMIESIRKGRESFTTLSNPKRLKTLKGTVVKYVKGMKLEKEMILWVERAAPEYVPLLSKVAGVITKVGGKLAHLSIVAREQNCPLVQSSISIISGVEVKLDFEKGVFL